MHHNPPETLTSFSRSPPLIQTHTLSLSLSLSLSLFIPFSLYNPRVSDSIKAQPWRCKPAWDYLGSSSFSVQVLSLSLSLFVLEKKLSLCELFRSVCDSLAFVFAGYTGTILVKNGKFSDLLGELQVFFFY